MVGRSEIPSQAEIGSGPACSAIGDWVGERMYVPKAEKVHLRALFVNRGCASGGQVCHGSGCFQYPCMEVDLFSR
jgi:hypothetical protein